jgi:tetratricopeptide (TPR) repeat protein
LDQQAPLLLVDTARTRDDVEAVRKRLQALPAPAPGGAPVLVALGSIDFHEHKFTQAAASFGQALAVDPKSAEANTAFAYLYWAQGDKSKAEAAFAEAAKLSSPHSPKQLQYAEFEVRIGNLDSAKAILDSVTKNTPEYLPAWVMLAQIAEQQKKYDEALSYVGKVLTIDTENPGALLEGSRIKLAKGDAASAVTDLESATRMYPKSATIDLEMAKAYMAAGSEDKAETSLNRVLAISPNTMDAQVMLAGIKVKKGDLRGALAILRAVVHAHPEAANARFLLGQTLRANGELDEARTVFQQLSDSFPHEIQPLMMLGTLDMQQRQPAMARVEFTKARLIDPDFLPALERLVDLDLEAKDYEGARKLLNEQIAAHPKDGVLQLILAKAFLAQRDAAGAESALKKAIELQPEGTRAYSLLAELYLTTNRQRDALADLQAAVAKNPKNTDALTLLAAIQDQQKDYPGARATYDKVLAINPNFVPALNNLAYIYSERFGDFDKALELAQKARHLLPDEPHIGDTEGWIFFHQRKYTNALALLKDSAEKLPSEADVHYHLGMAEYMLGQEDAALESLQHSLELSPEFPGRAEAVSHLAVLKLAPGKGGDAESAALEKELSAHKDDPVAMHRLGALYDQEGLPDKAIGAYEDALKASPDNATVLSRLARSYAARNEPAKVIEFGKRARQLAPDDPQLAHALGLAAYQTGDYPWSLSLLQEADQKLPDDPQVKFDLGKAYYSEGNVPDATAQLKLALQMSPSFARSAEAKNFIQMVDLAGDTKQAVAAEATIQQFLEAHPDDPTAIMASATVHEGNGDEVNAKKEYEKVLARFPDFSPAKRGLAIIYSKNGADDKTAFELAVKARAAFPDDAAVAQALGIIDFRRGDNFNAKNLLTDALAQRGEDPELNYYLGMTELNLKNSEAAKKAFQKALDLGLLPPHSVEARQALEKIK